ncbi:hypothetical protein BDY19DRAFT_370023 [Irpex rosettiformis]|uniref:Uncharacterized protein n=1 Tax=Irpex rosettiformis TaxID=378272 RepID=A0ACB8TVZ6_9APHY|nr:hypothetical protein BDY19DRAFT_370023 [Irpex rosettiformis]
MQNPEQPKRSSGIQVAGPEAKTSQPLTSPGGAEDSHPTLPTQTPLKCTSRASSSRSRRSRSHADIRVDANSSHPDPASSESTSPSHPRQHTLRHFSSTLHILKSLAVVPHLSHTRSRASKSHEGRHGHGKNDDASSVSSISVRVSVVLVGAKSNRKHGISKYGGIQVHEHFSKSTIYLSVLWILCRLCMPSV